MAVLAQAQATISWVDAGWQAVSFPQPPIDELVIGGGPVFLVNSARDLIFIDHEGVAFEIEPFLKEFVRVEVRDASEARRDAPPVFEENSGKLDF